MGRVTALATALLVTAAPAVRADPSGEASEEAEQPANTLTLTPEDVQTFVDATLDATPLHFAFDAFGNGLGDRPDGRRGRRRSTRPRSWSARASTPACGARSSSSTA
jgi:hypothetical protein